MAAKTTGEFCVVRNVHAKSSVWKHFSLKKSIAEGEIIKNIAVCDKYGAWKRYDSCKGTSGVLVIKHVNGMKNKENHVNYSGIFKRVRTAQRNTACRLVEKKILMLLRTTPSWIRTRLNVSDRTSQGIHHVFCCSLTQMWWICLTGGY